MHRRYSLPHRLGESSPEILERQATVHALDHPRVGVAHDRRDELGRRAGGPEPGGAGAPEVVRGAARDLHRVAGRVEVAADVRPRPEDGCTCSLHRVLAKVLTPCGVCDQARAMGDAIALSLEMVV